jgi:hypothetical protein
VGAYVFTSETISDIRTLAKGVLDEGGSASDDRVRAMAVLGELAGAEGLAAADIREVVEWAKDKAANFDILTQFSAEAKRTKLAETARIIELCKGILLALAVDRLPDAAVQVWGDQVDAAPRPPSFVFGANGKAGGPLQAVEAAPALHVRFIGEDEPANAVMPEAPSEPLPADALFRIALGRIAAICKGEPSSDAPLFDGNPLDVVEAVEGLRAELDDGDRFDVPDDCPLRLWDFYAWISTAVRCEELTAAAGTSARTGRVSVLREARRRIADLDRDGLRGLFERVGVVMFTECENAMFRAALGLHPTGVPQACASSDGSLVFGLTRVPRRQAKEPTP